MRRRRVLGVVILLALLIGAGGLAVAFDPAARVQGWVNGEPAYRGRYATAWRRDLRRTDEIGPAAAQKALADGKGEAVAVCVWLLKTAPEPAVRQRAADALLQMGKDAAPAGPALVAALADPDPLVRGVAVRAVAALAPDVPGGVAGLVGLFPDAEAVRAVANFKAAAADAVPHLIRLLKSEDDPLVRRQAVRALGRIGEPARPAVPDLMVLTRSDPEPGIRDMAAGSLADIGAADAVPALVAALDDPVPEVRRGAVAALGRLGAAATAALPRVRALLADPDPGVKQAAERAARLIDPPGR